MRLRPVVLSTLATLVLVGVAPSQNPGDVRLDIVKYDGLKSAVLKNRGKVVLVDFWGFF